MGIKKAEARICERAVRIRRCAMELVCVLVITVTARPAVPGRIRLQAQPQKFRTFYAINDARIPKDIRDQLAQPVQSGRWGSVRWSIESDTLIRDANTQMRLSFNEGLPVGRLKALAISTDGAAWIGGD